MAPAPTRNGAGSREAGQDDGRGILRLPTLYGDKKITETLLPEICPVCKSSRYLNQNMRFLVNPECYHKMCESCVDRIFSTGPAPCPIAGCARTLRKQRFRKQTFEDVKVEREVDVRKKVAKAYAGLPCN